MLVWIILGSGELLLITTGMVTGSPIDTRSGESSSKETSKFLWSVSEGLNGPQLEEAACMFNKGNW